MNRSLRIAVADDEPDMQDYFRTILPQLGHTVVVVVAGTGRELVERCRASRPDPRHPRVGLPRRRVHPTCRGRRLQTAAEVRRDRPDDLDGRGRYGSAPPLSAAFSRNGSSRRPQQ